MAQTTSTECNTLMDANYSEVCNGDEGYTHDPVPKIPPAWEEESRTPSLSLTEAGSSSGGSGNDFKPPVPVAICSMAMRLPGGISSAEEFWGFLVNKGDACARIPAQRYATHGPQGNSTGPSRSDAAPDAAQKDANAASAAADRPHWKTHGYVLNHVDLSAFDASLFSMTRAELDIVDPQQRLLLELTRECFENAGETGWRGKDVGVYIGSFGEDWNDIQHHDRHDLNLYKLVGTSDFVLANRISYEYDLKGPSMVLRTGCSASLYGLHLACQSLQAGDISSALVGGCNLIMSPQKVETMYNIGVLSKSASSRSFDAGADGYARGEAVNMIYVKRLDDALRDGNPIRAVIRATASNCDGKTPGLTKPSAEAHEALIRATYAAAGLENEMGSTGFFECHATGTSSGDPEEGRAVANVFGDKGGVYIGSVKPNVGHSEGASGLTSILKCVLALENRVVPPNIKFCRPNPKIPFERGGLRVPSEPIPWPMDRRERTSVNSFGVGGANAHVILDSAAAFGIRAPNLPAGPSGSRLLVFTANDAESARRGALKCSRHVSEKPETLTDAAYTLGLRREHLPYRSFAVRNKTNANVLEFSVPVKMPTAAPSVTFVFTGQGAQWPTMGAGLLSEHPSAMQDIRLMEMSLSSLGPDLAPNWILSEELMRPKESSKVYKAEFSQPLCTAVQIVLVNILRDWGIAPAAVIGHSSGEIAAAYACGAFSMQEAIVCAYLRGRVTRQPTTSTGAMAAVGIGARQLQPYLVDGAVIACENSPYSTTLSGDEAKITDVLQTLKQDHPDVFMRRLQVDMAYHSHHMKELGEEYERLLAPHLAGKAPAVPFFSTVTNEVIRAEGQLGASYWRSNLESPVLFQTGVETLLQSQGSHSVLVEVGPHSALAGPLRQILKHLKAEQMSYVATLARHEDDNRALLGTAGQLFCKGIPIRFGAVNPAGRVLTSLPCYPWNRETKYWYESRVSREYRGRPFAHHPILGSRVVETSQTEPNWRNMLRLDDAPWCRDHKVAGDVVFPGTGYLAMAGEAMRQLSGARDITLRQVTIASALILSSAATEIVTSMRPCKLTNTLDSAWHEFAISSYNETSTSWTKHCFGQVRAGSDHPLQEKRDITHLPREVEPDYWYKAMRGIGLSYGPAFQGLGRISADPLHNVAVADLRLDAVPEPEVEDGATYYVHPATSDACMQLFSAAAARGQARSMHGKAVPTYIGEAYFQSRSGASITVEARANVQPNGSILGSCVGVDPSTKTVVVALRDVKLAPLDDGDMTDKDPHAGGRLHWKPDLDFQDAGRLIHSRKKVREAYYRLQKLVLLCCIVAREECGGIATQAPHLAKFQRWIGEQVEQAEQEGYPLLSQAEIQELLQLSPVDRSGRIPQFLERVLETEYATIGSVVCRVFGVLAGILRGEVDGLEVLRQDDALAEIYSLGNQWDYGPFLRLLNHRTPHLRVLEIGAGTGATTDLVLRGLEGTFYSYTFTDVSAGFFPAARERFRRVGSRMRFQTLDVSRDPTEQGFASNSFDLIVAANVLHVTPRLAETLANVRRLLCPDGRLLIQEMHMTVKWLNFAMGPLPGWWLGEQDGRSEEPYVSPQRWAQELVTAGFSPPQASVYDDEAPYQANVTMIAVPDISWAAPEQTISLLSTLPGGEVATSISAALQKFGLEVEPVSLSDKPNGAVISIIDLEGKPFLSDITPEEYARFQTFLSNLNPTGVGMLWLTKPSQMRCADPRYAGILGLLRTARNELGTPLCTLELDGLSTPSSSPSSSPPPLEETWRVVFDVYQKARRMRAVEQDALSDPDYEFAFSGGIVYLPRFHWISVAGELVEPVGDHQVYKRLEIGKRGSLQTMKWVEKPILNNLKGEEIYVDVRAVGMNFKDTLIAMGIINGPEEAGDGFGVELSGVVRAIGPEVTDLSVGDRVMGITSDAYATMTKTAASRVMKIPEDLSFEEAAGMPCVYPTVVHSLINLARLESGQSVLIHSACGGVGLAALYVCQMLGVSEVYATVGSPEKVKYLMDTFGLPPSRIFSSRDASFLPGVMRETAGRGVDVVLNSLSGELLHASWRCVAEFGSMVEIGKRDFLGQGRLEMESFVDNRAFFGVEMWPLIIKQPTRIRRLMDQFMGYYRTGALKPIRPVRVFDAVDIEAAIRTMQKGQHIGKLVVRIPEDASMIKATRVRQSFRLRADACYLMVGGLGGLGRSISTWMAERGARHFVFLSRSGDKKPEAAALVRDLEGAGCTVRIVAGSVTEMSDVVRAVKQAPTSIAGVVQLSMILRDHLFADMPFSDWEAVTEPKIRGTWNLHEAVLTQQQQPLDFFVLFSSFAGLVGQRGQANYAAANAFLDAFVQFRHNLGLCASVLDLGAVADVGYVAERPDLVNFFKTTSHHLLREQDVLDALELAIRKSTPPTPPPGQVEFFVSDSQVTLAMRSTIPLSSPQNRNVWKRDPRLSLYHNLEAERAERGVAVGTGGTATGEDGDQDAAIRAVLAAVEEDSSVLQQDVFIAQFARLIGVAFFSFMMKPVEDLDVMAGLATLGIDSLVTIEVRNWLRLRFAIDMSVLEILRAENIMGIAKAAAAKFMAKLALA